MSETKIYWTLHNHCTAGCFYCPSQYWSGEVEHSVNEYLDVTKQICDHFSALNRNINWTFDGGEPLAMFDFPMILKLCKDNNGKITLKTNGGRLWLDWWAIAPNVDHLILTYHYWQNKNLINYIIDTFIKAEKSFEIIVPFRPGHVNEDMQRLLELEARYTFKTTPTLLHRQNNNLLGYLDYTEEEIINVMGKDFLFQLLKDKMTTFENKNEIRMSISPSYSGKLCNVGIEQIYISADGWATGSSCNNTPLGNIWNKTFSLPNAPSVCKMISCVNNEDQKITKFI